MNRRDFIGTSTLAAAGWLAPHAFAQEKEKVAANDKIHVALIGCGGMGNANLSAFVRLPDFEIVALCDPDANQFARSKKILSDAKRDAEIKTYEDYRTMLDERKDIDCVIIGTPDHHHAYALIHACFAGRGGKGCHVYCEKPISHNIVEGRAMVNAVKKQKVVCQVGTQQRSGQHFKDAVKYVHDGKLGEVKLCRTFITNRTGPEGSGKPADEDSPPQGVNYDLWLGPAPLRKFNRVRFHGSFRWFWDYGNGLCNDWGVHLNDIILWGMKVQSPISVYACGGKFAIHDNSDTPDTLDVVYTYPNFTHVYTVRRGPYHFGFEFFNNSGHGMEFQGTRGVLSLHRGGWMVTADGDAAEQRHGGSEQHFTHVKNFLECLRNRDQQPASSIEAMHFATTTCHLANISFKLQRKIYWDGEQEKCFKSYDPATKKFSGEDRDANALLFREPRKGWKLTL